MAEWLVLVKPETHRSFVDLIIKALPGQICETSMRMVDFPRRRAW